MISRWHALLAFRFPDIQKACQNFLAKLISIPISISLILIFNIQTNNEISAFKNLVIGNYFRMKWKSKNKIKLLHALSNSAKKIGVSANKNDLIVISISFLAFNFRGERVANILPFPPFSFLIYAKIRILVECNGKKFEVKEKRISNSTDENYFILSRWKIGRELHRWFPWFPYLYFVALSPFSIIFFPSFDHSNFPFLQNNGFCESIKENNTKYTDVLKRIKKRLLFIWNIVDIKRL